MKEDEKMSKMLKVCAMQAGMCDKFTKEWADSSSPEEIIDKFKRGLDFCIKNDWPSSELVHDFFERDFLKAHHIYDAEEAFSAGGYNDVATIVQHGSTGELRFGGFDTTTIWVRHDSELFVSACGHAVIFVHVYDDAHVTVEQSGDARITVKRHSDRALVLRTGNVKYIDPWK